MIRIAGLLAVALAVVGCQPGAAKTDVVGTWRYDVRSLKLELNDQAQHEVTKEGEKGRQIMAKVMDDMAKTIAPIRFEFAADGTATVSAEGLPQSATGKWKIEGNRLVISGMPTQAAPADMTFTSDRNRILTTYRDENVGTATVDLVRQ